MFSLEKATRPAPTKTSKPNKTIGRRVKPNVRRLFSTDYPSRRHRLHGPHGLAMNRSEIRTRHVAADRDADLRHVLQCSIGPVKSAGDVGDCALMKRGLLCWNALKRGV